MSDVMLYEGEGVEVLGYYTAGAMQESCRYILSNGNTLQVDYCNSPNYGQEDMPRGIPLSVTLDACQPKSQGRPHDLWVCVVLRDGTEREGLTVQYKPHTPADVDFLEAARQNVPKNKAPTRSGPGVTLPEGYEIPDTEKTIAVNGTARKLLAIQRIYGTEKRRRYRYVSLVLDRGQGFGIPWHVVPGKAREKPPRIPDEIKELTPEEAAGMNEGEAMHKRMAVYRNEDGEETRDFITILAHTREDCLAIAARYARERKTSKPKEARKSEPATAPAKAEPEDANTLDKLAARVDTVLKISGMDGKLTRGQMIVKEVRDRLRDGMNPIDVCRQIAREDFNTACKTGTGRWLRKAKALAVHHALMRGSEPSKADIERLAQTLKRERNRTLKIPAQKAKPAKPRK